MVKAIILNDTSREDGHLGCALVMDNIHKLCAKHNIEVVSSIKRTDVYLDNDYENILDRTDIVIVNGEGSMHDDQDVALNLIKSLKIAKKKNKKMFLINTVWQNNNILNDYLHFFEKIYVRESLSQKEVIAAGFDAEVVPDLSLYTDISDVKTNVKKDNIQIIDSIIKKHTNDLSNLALRLRAKFYCMGHGAVKLYELHHKYRKYRLRLKGCGLQNINELNDIAKHEAMLSGRFHAVCIAMKLKTPFLFIGSNTHKIEGLLSDVGVDYNDYLITSKTYNSSKSEIIEFVKSNYSKNEEKFDKYVNSAIHKIENMFSEIARG